MDPVTARVHSRPMPIEIDIAHVARLARLKLDDEELAEYSRQCADILEHAARIQALDTEGVVPTAHALAMTNSFREDEVEIERIVDRDEVLAQAPDVEGVYFRVPPAIKDT